MQEPDLLKIKEEKWITLKRAYFVERASWTRIFRERLLARKVNNDT